MIGRLPADRAELEALEKELAAFEAYCQSMRHQLELLRILEYLHDEHARPNGMELIPDLPGAWGRFNALAGRVKVPELGRAIRLRLVDFSGVSDYVAARDADGRDAPSAGVDRTFRMLLEVARPVLAEVRAAIRGQDEERDLADRLAARGPKGQPQLAALVRYMTGRERAPLDDIKRHVQGDHTNSDKSVAMTASRTTGAVRKLGSPLEYRIRGGFVEKVRQPE